MPDPLIEPSEPTPSPQSDGTARVVDRQPMALEVLKRHAMYAAGAGLVPVPLDNLAGVVAVEIKLLKELASHYGVPFRRDRVKSIAAALVGGALSTELGLGAAGLANGAPFIGGALCIAALPAFAGAVTYASGQIFIQHFESGGTFLDFDPAIVKEQFREFFHASPSAAAAACS